MRWDSIAKIHEIQFIKYLSIWLSILPVMAGLVESDFVKKAGLSFQLPFSWGALYFAAIIFLVSMVIYSMRCPKIIKDYKGWHDYRDREGSYEKLIPLVTEVVGALGSARRVNFIMRRFKLGQIKALDENGGEIPQSKWEALSKNLPMLKDILGRSTSNKDSIPDVYAATREEAQTTRPLSRLVILIFHITAAALIGYIFLQNCAFVLEHYFPEFTSLLQWR